MTMTPDGTQSEMLLVLLTTTSWDEDFQVMRAVINHSLAAFSFLTDIFRNLIT